MNVKFLLLFLHLMFVATWLGCVLTEALFEHSIEPDWEMRSFIARLHWSIDKYVEIPSFIGVLITGVALLFTTAVTPLLIVKIAFGLLAIVSNALCVLLVAKRLAAVRANDVRRYEQLDHWQHKWGALVLLGIVVAMAVGGYLFANTNFQGVN
jgi:putative copper export protein